MCESHSWEENKERELEGAASETCLERGLHLCGWRSEEILGKDWGGGGGRPFRMTGAAVRWAVVGLRLAWGDPSACNSEGWAGWGCPGRPQGQLWVEQVERRTHRKQDQSHCHRGPGWARKGKLGEKSGPTSREMPYIKNHLRLWSL